LPYIEHLTRNLSNQQYTWRVIHRPDSRAADPKLLGRPADEFEKEVMERFLRRNPEPALGAGGPEFVERYVNQGLEYQYYQAIRAQASCLALCHKTYPDPSGFDVPIGGKLLAGEPLQEGDLMAVVQVTIPNGPTQAAVTETWNWLFAISIVTAFLALVAFYLVIRYVIIRPLRHLRDVSEAISRGNTQLRAEIHTGDEFETLADAFNCMLHSLITTQEELRQVNADLDAKVDQLAQLNMQLYEMNRIKSEFMATMSHELRTPLNSILGFSEVLASAQNLDERQRRFVGNIQKAGRVLLEMINNILDLAKIESGRMELRPLEFDVGQMILAECDLARPLSEKKKLELLVELQPNLPPMFQDEYRLRQILNNLLSNAIKFTPEGGRIKVSARKDNGFLVLQVSDTGVGISEEDQQVIFEKFRQGRTAMPAGDPFTREHSGSGLGLSIVKELCRLMGGEVSVQSQLGVGSTFTVRVPWHLEKHPLGEFPAEERLETAGKFRLEGKWLASSGEPRPA
jgi:signal transduction histidine kinase